MGVEMNEASRRKKSVLQNERGIATVETIPLLAIFVILLAYSFGTFGIIHTGILNSIAARTYAFETFRNRTNLVYFRDSVRPGVSIVAQHYKRNHNRVHGIRQEIRPGDPAPGEASFYATERPIRIGLGGVVSDGTRNMASVHNEKIFTDVREQLQTSLGVSPVWVMTQYGICLNADCGGE